MLNLFKNYPFIREVGSPLTKEQLRPLDPRCERVQFYFPLTDREYPVLADFLSDYPHVCLRVYDLHKKVVPDLAFLRFFPGIRDLCIGLYKLLSVKGIELVSPGLVSFSFGATKRTISLNFLKDSPDLRRLHIEGHQKDIAVIRELKNLEKLTLRSITLRDLGIIADLESLWWFALKLGGTRNLNVLSKKRDIKYLEIWRVREFHDLDFLSEMTGLQYLFLQALPHIHQLPDLSKLTSLRRIHLESLKGLNDLQQLSTAPNLEELIMPSMKQLHRDDFRPLLYHPTLQRIYVGTGSRKRNEEIVTFLEREPAKESKFDFQFK